MATFLIQANHGQVMHDFTFHLIQAIKYTNWYHSEVVHKYVLADTPCGPSSTIPVGSVEFVLSFYKQFYNISHIKPINIPQSLMKAEFLKRVVEFKSGESIEVDTLAFVKSNEHIKGFTNILNPGDRIPEGDFLLSEVVPIDSEWRGFVYNGELLDLRCYTGDFSFFPDVSIVRDMVRAFKDAPKAYTIDVGVSNRGAFLIEIHQFFSCGLYGFADYKVLPQMFISCHREITERAG